jgi:hypothetical protein
MTAAMRGEGHVMNTRTTRRTALAALGAGVAGAATHALFAPDAAMAAHSSAAGVVAGGSLEGPNGLIQFSAFGSRMEFADPADLHLFGAIAWHDPAGLGGEPLTLSLASVASYGPDPADADRARIMSGTINIEGEDGEHPFALRFVDNGDIGPTPDSVRLVIGEGAAELAGTPVVAGVEGGFAYDVGGDLTAGDVQIVAFP